MKVGKFLVSSGRKLLRDFLISGSTAKLANKYTAHVQKLPIAYINYSKKVDQIVEKLNTLNQASKAIRSSSDLLVSYHYYLIQQLNSQLSF